MSAPKSQQTASTAAAVSKDDSMLAFIPAGMPRSIAEYLVGLLPGAILLFAFFLAAEVALLVTNNNIVAIAFFPVICIMPILSGAISTLVLEKVRKKPLTLKRGAMVGAVAGLAGALAAVLMMTVIFLFLKKEPFGSSVQGLLVYAVFLLVLAMDTVLAALGGALVVKFLKEV